jgi:hypothetical protein
MADEKPKKLSLKEIAERAAKTQPQLSPGAPPRVTYNPGDPLGSSPPASRPPTSQPPTSTPPTSVPPAPTSSAPTSTPPTSKPPAAPPSAPVAAKPTDASKTSAKSGEKTAKADEKTPKKAEPKADEPASPLPFLVGGIVIVSLLAIGYAVVKRPQGPSATTLATATVTTATAAPSATPSAAPSVSAAPASGDLDINALGAATSADPSKPAGPLAKDPKDPKDSKDPKDKKADAPPAATSAVALGPAGELSDEIKKRMGGGGGAKAEADTGGGPPADAKESKPSAGAVAGALNAIRGAARACLADTEDVARINIVFGSSGAAQSATVTGAGAAEGCVRAAVMKAKVAPFTDATFSTSFTVRP